MLQRGQSQALFSRGSEHNVKCRRLHLNLRNRFFRVRTIKHWHTLPERLSSRVAILGGTKKLPGPNCGQCALGSPAWAQGLEKMTSRVPVQPQPFCVLVVVVTHLYQWKSLFCYLLLLLHLPLFSSQKSLLKVILNECILRCDIILCMLLYSIHFKYIH